MVPLEAWLFAGSVVAFAAATWLVGGRKAEATDDFVALADAEGWDHRPAPPEGLLGRFAELAGVVPEATGELYLAGPSSMGPFCLLRSGGPERARTDRPRAASWTFVHLRTARASPGVWVRPAPRFVPHASGPRRRGDLSRRLRVEGDDAEALDRLTEQRGLALLLRPADPVRLGWEGHDLVVAFPLGVSSARGASMLVRYAEALARVAEGQPVVHPGALRSRAVAERPSGATAT